MGIELAISEWPKNPNFYFNITLLMIDFRLLESRTSSKTTKSTSKIDIETICRPGETVIDDYRGLCPNIYILTYPNLTAFTEILPLCLALLP